MLDPFAGLPFRTLRPDARERLRATFETERFLSGTCVLRQGDTSSERVYILLEGTVEVLDPSRGADRVVGRIGAGHYFGERRALFGSPRKFDIRAVTDVVCVSFPGKQMREIVRTAPAFAWTLARILREKQGLFADFERFLAEVLRDAGRGHLVIPRLLYLYKRLQPALHRRAGSDRIDFDALDYAVPRLPDDITQTLSLFLTDELPWLYSQPDRTFEAVGTRARRRTAYRMMPGKLLVLLRAGSSDLLDLVCCLCVLAVEARKLRRRLNDPELLAACEHDESTPLPFTAEELARLERLWPGQVRRRLHEIAVHHEDFTISVFKRLGNYDAAKGERWTRQVADATADLLGVDPHAFDDDFDVHVVSSNTHSVTNLLSVWLPQHREAILAWGREHRADLSSLAWTHEDDLVVALTRDYLRAHPEANQARKQLDREGCRVLDQTAFTGIEVQLFDLSRLSQRAYDPSLPRPTRPGLLVNIDYAFGQQAEPIMGSLVALFGRNLRSVNVLGKAGGLMGRRGDLLVATRFVQQHHDRVLALPSSVDLQRLRARLPDREVFVGPVLTVEGTLLQNDVLLQYYRRLAGCVGLEMEGTWYARQLLEAQQLGTMRHDAAMRFLYYISDLPLSAGHSLSGSLSMLEGVPPLYAATREVLHAVLSPGPHGEAS
jgi:CRP-like cAMP-binding protein